MNINFKKSFNDNNIEKVKRIMEKYLPSLFYQEDNIKIHKEILRIEETISLMYSSNISQLFSEYENLAYEDTLQQNWLAYYIGFKRGVSQQKLKNNQKK